jgi:hypothetical protein
MNHHYNNHENLLIYQPPDPDSRSTQIDVKLQNPCIAGFQVQTMKKGLGQRYPRCHTAGEFGWLFPSHGIMGILILWEYHENIAISRDKRCQDK